MSEPYYSDPFVTIWHGDVRDLWPQSGDVLLTDPPYGIAYDSGAPRATLPSSIQGDEDTSLRDWVLSYWDKPALVFGSWKAPRPVETRMVLIWDQGPALGMGALDLPWKQSWQEVYVLGRGFAGHRDGGVLRYPPVQSMATNGRLHPHEKPVPLLRYLLGKCPRGTVLDPFMGSGSTLRAAKDLGLQAIGIELDERYCEIAARRMGQEVLDLSPSSQVVGR